MLIPASPQLRDTMICKYLVLVAVATTAASMDLQTPRRVNCVGARENIDPNVQRLYEFAFDGYDQGSYRNGEWTLVFQGLVSLSGVAEGAGDLTEMLTTIRSLQQAFTAQNSSVNSTVQLWIDTWAGIGDRAAQSAQLLEASGHNRSAAHAYGRAWNYLSTAERLADHTTSSALNMYRASVLHFQRYMKLQSRPCVPMELPFQNIKLHGYFCSPHGHDQAGSGRPTLLVVNGYDGTAEALTLSVGMPAVQRGMNAYIFEGPGQGSVARFQNATFIPDWEVVVQAAMDGLRGHPGVDSAKFVVWGESFGGYLAPRAFSRVPDAVALVANGGVKDFLQAMVCALPAFLQDLLYSDSAKFDEIMQIASQSSIPLQFLLRFGELGFGAQSPSALYNSFQAYALEATDFQKISGRPVLVYNPQVDFLVGNQSELFFEALGHNALPDSTKLLTVDGTHGSGLHCGIGSTTIVADLQFDWLEDVLSAS